MQYSRKVTVLICGGGGVVKQENIFYWLMFYLQQFFNTEYIKSFSSSNYLYFISDNETSSIATLQRTMDNGETLFMFLFSLKGSSDAHFPLVHMIL